MRAHGDLRLASSYGHGARQHGRQACSPRAALLVASQMFAYALSPTAHVNTRFTAATEPCAGTVSETPTALC